MNDPVYDDPNRCIKDDESAVGPCMCPDCLAAASTVSSDYIPKGLVLTDNDLADPEAIQRVAYHFICSKCKKDNTADYMSYCPDCGTRVIIRSQKVLEFLRSYAASQSVKTV